MSFAVYHISSGLQGLLWFSVQTEEKKRPTVRFAAEQPGVKGMLDRTKATEMLGESARSLQRRECERNGW